LKALPVRPPGVVLVINTTPAREGQLVSKGDRWADHPERRGD